MHEDKLHIFIIRQKAENPANPIWHNSRCIGHPSCTRWASVMTFGKFFFVSLDNRGWCFHSFHISLTLCIILKINVGRRILFAHELQYKISQLCLTRIFQIPSAPKKKATCDPSLEGGTAPPAPYPPMLQLLLLLNCPRCEERDLLRKSVNSLI